jgi:hypothetical protein
LREREREGERGEEGKGSEREREREGREGGAHLSFVLDSRASHPIFSAVFALCGHSG